LAWSQVPVPKDKVNMSVEPGFISSLKNEGNRLIKDFFHMHVSSCHRNQFS
jgi:hypothetical protein